MRTRRLASLQANGQVEPCSKIFARFLKPAIPTGIRLFNVGFDI